MVYGKSGSGATNEVAALLQMRDLDIVSGDGDGQSERLKCRGVALSLTVLVARFDFAALCQMSYGKTWEFNH